MQKQRRWHGACTGKQTGELCCWVNDRLDRVHFEARNEIPDKGVRLAEVERNEHHVWVRTGRKFQ